MVIPVINRRLVAHDQVDLPGRPPPMIRVPLPPDPARLFHVLANIPGADALPAVRLCCAVYELRTVFCYGCAARERVYVRVDQARAPSMPDPVFPQLPGDA